MQGCFFRALSLAAAILSGGHALAQAPAEGSNSPGGGLTDEQGGDDLPVPSPSNPFSQFDFDRLLGAQGDHRADPDLRPKPPGVKAPVDSSAAQKSRDAKAEQLKKALAPKPAPEAARKKILDALFERLRQASNTEDAQRVAETIERLWLKSHSDTANLLMSRATTQVQAGNYDLALRLYDKLVALEPDWAEAWNQRATTRFLTGDMDGAMADIGRVMKLEPRHFGALAGMGIILQGAGLDKSALEIFKKALVIYPLEPDIQKLVEKLTLEVEGQDL
ncbi:MAG TPA: tetratricopeptide repeat protein [Methylocella sp.]|nr:tetratricopeptide repeat protein [Methylocella sp.]